MKSTLMKLNTNDFIRGLVVAVLAVVLGSLQQALTEHGIDVASYDWSSILNLAITAAVAYLSKNLLSDEQGKVLGAVG